MFSHAFQATGMMTPNISIVTACYNEQENVRELYDQVKRIFQTLPEYTYEHLFIDNASTDQTVSILKEIATADARVKLIVNTRNFGHIRSPFHGLIQAYGEAVISIVADLQDPPELIVQFLEKWREGYKVVAAVKVGSDESKSLYALRKLYYEIIARLAEVKLIKNFTGFGLYDKQVIELLRHCNDPYPYFRGLIADFGFPVAEITYHQPIRKRGITKNNFYTLYDMAMLGLTSHSKVPLRLVTMLGFASALFSLGIGFIYFIYKLLYWNNFYLGLAPLVIGLFFLGSVQLVFLGIVGEFVGAIHTQVVNRPRVIEKERINF